jgi:serine/threonine protein kinase
VTGIAHCHAQGIIHGDIKPHNIMVAEDNSVKILDFGLSKGLQDLQANTDQKREITGTPYYMAPESFNTACFTEKSDIWALGVLLYILLSGYMPFPATTQEELEVRVRSQDVNFRHKSFRKVSEEAKQLISSLLQKDGSKRPTAMQILDHPWFSKYAKSQKLTAEDLDLDQQVFHNLL